MIIDITTTALEQYLVDLEKNVVAWYACRTHDMDGLPAGNKRKAAEEDWNSEGCSCHICPPCGYCTSHCPCDICGKIVSNDDITETEKDCISYLICKDCMFKPQIFAKIL